MKVPSVSVEGPCYKSGRSAVRSVVFVVVRGWVGQVVWVVGGTWFGARGTSSVCQSGVGGHV